MRPASTLALIVLLSWSFNMVSAQTIQGHLLDVETGEPIILAQITLLTGSGEVADETFTDETGYFKVRSEAPGNFFLRAERMSYRAHVDGIFELGDGGILTVEFRLGRAPIVLDTLSVQTEIRERDRQLSLLGFYDRQRAGFGRFIGPEEIERTPVFQATDFLRMIPRVRINERPFSQSTVTIAGSTTVRGEACYPKVFIDGTVVFRGGGEEAKIDEVISPHDIKAIEVFRGIAEIPLQFAGASSPCGVILIWTG